jgi:hypothetical protein
MTGSGEFASVPEACRAAICEADSVTPDADANFYSKAHAIYAAIYPVLRPIYIEIARLA